MFRNSGRGCSARVRNQSGRTAASFCEGERLAASFQAAAGVRRTGRSLSEHLEASRAGSGDGAWFMARSGQDALGRHHRASRRTCPDIRMPRVAARGGVAVHPAAPWCDWRRWLQTMPPSTREVLRTACCPEATLRIRRRGDQGGDHWAGILRQLRKPSAAPRPCLSGIRLGRASGRRLRHVISARICSLAARLSSFWRA